MTNVKRKETIKKLKNVTNREFIFGDFDGDGIPNIDDPHPFFKPKGKARPSHEILLSDEINSIEQSLDRANGNLAQFVGELKRDPEISKNKIEYRVKNAPSVVNKLRRWSMHKLNDLGGARIIVNDEKEMRKVKKLIEKNYGDDIKEELDFYKKPRPKNPHYRAVHFNLKFEGTPIELQLKTRRTAEVSEAYHSVYKRGKSKESEKKFALLMDMAIEADNGNEIAAKKFDSLKITPKMFED